MSLLLLRVVLAIALLVQGGLYIGGQTSAGSAWLAGLAALAAGSLLLVGFLTPVAGLIAAVGAAGIALSLFPKSSPTVFDSVPAVIYALTMLLTVIGTGPGRFSVDARIFGRREIIIPRSQRGHKS
jgi:uncharacterized membrane protein YphA (DoxX/SURF4 family)